MLYNPNNRRRGTLFNALASMVTLFSISQSGEIKPGTVAHFNLPNCPDGWSQIPDSEGRFLLGAGNDGNITYKLGDIGGEIE
ncbi:MAG: hypothetical protein GY821_00580 [Gammaproteobacteria bacterium]|nr:hypothetical protein [Gammaproteobacteria bacterium]